jgi:hypothetical protein
MKEGDGKEGAGSWGQAQFKTAETDPKQLSFLDES